MYTEIINHLNKEVKYQKEQARYEHDLLGAASITNELARKKMARCYEHAIATVQENRRRRNFVLDALLDGKAVPVADVETCLDITFDQACKIFRIIDAKEHTEHGMIHVQYFALRR